MKNKNILIVIVSLLFFSTNIFAQGPGKWSKPIPHPCYKGLLVSVVNMGYNDNRKDYPWGVRIINKYKIPVSFKYLLSVGGEKMGSTKFQYSVAYKLGAGKEEIDGKDLFTAISFQSSSDDWTVMIGEVCFDGMRCGGEDECYAECDKDVENPKPNQPCGLSASASPNEPKREFEPSAVSGTEAGEKKKEEETPNVGETTNWQRDDKLVEIIMGKTEKGIYWKRKNDKKYTFFEKLESGAYRYEVGKDTYIIQFVSATKIQFSENGTVTNHYNLVANEDDGESKVRSGLWSKGSSNSMVRITVTKDGLTYHYINNSSDDGSPFYKRISSTEYRLYQANGILYDVLILKEDGRLHKLFTDKNPGSFLQLDELIFRSAEEDSASTNGDKYIFKGTTIWKTSSGGFVLYAIIDNFLYQTDEGGGPWWHGSNKWQLRDMKSNFTKKAPDTYEYIISKESRNTIEFIGPDKLQDDTYYKGGRKLFRADTYPLAGKWSAESLPQATKQNIFPSDINGIWNFEPVYNALKISFTLLSQEGDKIVLTRKYLDTETFTYKKISANTYEFKPENMVGTALLVFLSPTRICLSYVYKNYVSIGYYNKPAAPPIVKQENKPVTEEVLKGKVTQWQSNNGTISEMEMKDNGLYFSAMYSDEDRSKPAFFKKVSATTYIYISNFRGSHRVVFQGEGRMYYESYQPQITSRPFDTHADYRIVK